MKRTACIAALLAAVLACGNSLNAQVAQSHEMATKVKHEGLDNSRVEEIARFMTDHPARPVCRG